MSSTQQRTQTPPQEVQTSGLEGTARAIEAGSVFFDDHGGFDSTWRWPFVAPDSKVMASIAELDSSGNPTQGLASLEVHNVVPRRGEVKVRGFVGWESNLRIRISMIAVNDF